MYQPNTPTPLEKLLHAAKRLRRAIGHNVDCNRVQRGCHCTCQASIEQAEAIALYDKAYEELIASP